MPPLTFRFSLWPLQKTRIDFSGYRLRDGGSQARAWQQKAQLDMTELLGALLFLEKQRWRGLQVCPEIHCVHFTWKRTTWCSCQLRVPQGSLTKEVGEEKTGLIGHIRWTLIGHVFRLSSFPTSQKKSEELQWLCSQRTSLLHADSIPTSSFHAQYNLPPQLRVSPLWFFQSHFPEPRNWQGIIFYFQSH